MKLQALDQHGIRALIMSLFKLDSSLNSWQVLRKSWQRLDKSCANLVQVLVKISRGSILSTIFIVGFFRSLTKKSNHMCGLPTKFSKVKRSEHFYKVYLIEHENNSDIAERYQSCIFISAHSKEYWFRSEDIGHFNIFNAQIRNRKMF